MTKHTLGPWKISEFSPLTIMAQIDGENVAIGRAEQKTGFKDILIDGVANACLMAASPELLAVLKCAQAMDILNQEFMGEDMRRLALAVLVSHGYDPRGDITFQQFVNQKMEKAIAKAEGR